MAADGPEPDFGLVDVYRHDAHKLRDQAHATAPDTDAGVAVNRPVPHNADADAAALSRPPGRGKRTLPNHTTGDRVSLVDGTARDPSAAQSAADNPRRLLRSDDATVLHRRWLRSDVAAARNESGYTPYTSLKYHTLLVAALFDAYRAGWEFDELWLVVDSADAITAHRTVYTGDRFSLRIDGDTRGRPAARLGSRPWRSWASTWNRLTAHPLDADTDRWDRVVDANLRRIGAWSTALQYLEDVRGWPSP